MLYNLRREMLKYCYDDCLVLATAFSKFNELMIMELKSTGIKGIIDHDYTILADFYNAAPNGNSLVCGVHDE